MRLKEYYTIALISNYPLTLRQKLEDQGIASLFDEIIISTEVGYQKPDPQIFKILCERLSIPMSELVFIDDRENSLKGAVTLGYTPVLYTNNQELFNILSTILGKEIR